ncbi:hypothetical protein AXF42_Ash005812 [Apostasia shenzhenica]|uniref:RING-type domain-containing protein n=1 Tax=Apostasia shenzhenica TaxID=1088818 RepID=A0A2I0BCF9_9ASPA|nr:hypothetical protein AXF42_Ash005812 [Apostasia shenzhenica]
MPSFAGAYSVASTGGGFSFPTNNVNAPATAAARTCLVKSKGAAMSLPCATVPNSLAQSIKGKGIATSQLSAVTRKAGIPRRRRKVRFATADAIVKFLNSYREMSIASHIRDAAVTNIDHKMKPLGESCQLCELDMAFWPKTCESPRPNHRELPSAAILPCGHCYHLSCLDLISDNAAEPQCISCL